MRRYLLAGLIVWLPILGTFYILRFIIRLLDQTVALLPTKYHPDQLFGTHIPGLGLVLTLIILFITGMIVSNFIGKHLMGLWDKLLSRIPLVRSIYNAFKQIVTSLVTPGDNSFRKVLLIEYPRKGIWSIGFQTSSQFAGVPSEPDVVMVFIPTTPNPTSGFLTVVPTKDTIELEMSVEDALKVIISLGMIMPSNMCHTAASSPGHKPTAA